MQETQVQSLVWKDSTCHGATKPVSHNMEARAPKTCTLQEEKPPQWEAPLELESSPHLPQLEKARMQQWRHSTAKNKWIFLKE